MGKGMGRQFSFGKTMQFLRGIFGALYCNPLSGLAVPVVPTCMSCPFGGDLRPAKCRSGKYIRRRRYLYTLVILITITLITPMERSISSPSSFVESAAWGAVNALILGLITDGRDCGLV